MIDTIEEMDDETLFQLGIKAIILNDVSKLVLEELREENK